MGQPLTQTPPAQSWPAAQAILHAPQLPGSVAVTVQAPAHDVVPEGQTQSPSLHTRSVGQIVPQLPQLSDALRRSTQALPHGARPAPHDDPHCPLLQTCVGVHALAQPPQ